ncbi:MAG: hypothetical protein U1E06_02625 [Tabrizicola sp.]|uniref:hypothetical protein n=1 Tax=Tabrizicola sp. TaxID=2005166 RepID=UPI002733788F|nr:hypothetical protein [Tabrizicola sp.]MDP3261775.1 hypothetical protein [Tabrizicola sp.]MDP3648841.1 hypothetical protein [Paracoccaceae bacterium]MDZ4065742.1 hypothetical protein [Tabrizicola sp.]
MRLAVLLSALAFPALAETPLTGPQFDANVTGSTITYDYGGGLFGTEEYLPDRAVRWAFEGDTCVYGTWYQRGEQICFVYDNEPTPQCWLYFLENGGIRGRYMGPDGGWEILESQRTTNPLSCAGPDVGV